MTAGAVTPRDESGGGNVNSDTWKTQLLTANNNSAEENLSPVLKPASEFNVSLSMKIGF